jgi:Ca2+-binding RTX toxin-like protein
VTVHLEPSSERDEVRSGENIINFTWAARIWWVHGTNQADVILGSHRRDHLDGHPGADEPAGLGANDEVYGYEGADTISGGSGEDDVRGGDGSDTLYTQEDGSADRISCGDDDDTVYYDEGLDSFTFDDCETKLTTQP